ncbi:4447_t:CDS:1, partial [Gigaspora rosea]
NKHRGKPIPTVNHQEKMTHTPVKPPVNAPVHTPIKPPVRRSK